MSTHLPIALPDADAHALRSGMWDCASKPAGELSHADIGQLVVFPVVLREAKISATVHGEIRRVHMHTDEVEIDITNTDEGYSEWSTFTVAPEDPVFITNYTD
ncbi:hypothetical protein SEA_STROSAHL_78 [Gordonia phage Strosahl]|nr:hypothetical protein FDH03_gp032 [Gordonia phage Strosahl]AOE44788.1 hypothetical protein SEA_STROSAHL_78 [Gordonia phage Strosahl]